MPSTPANLCIQCLIEIKIAMMDVVLIKTKEIPNKEWAAYNNYVQSIAADMVVDKLFKIKELLSDKKSQFMYQVFDSFVFDIHPEELYLLENIKNILEKNGKYNFDIQYITGKNLMECTEQIIEEEIDSVN